MFLRGKQRFYEIRARIYKTARKLPTTNHMYAPEQEQQIIKH